jgi:carbonic anhydrase/acetyltransferase-like protein (isoleucine patch superfamily)
MIRSYRGIHPRIAPSAYIDPSAQVIGDVQIGDRSSVWPLAVLRGDVNAIRIGEETNIQDHSVLHGQTGEYPVIIGNRVTVGHSTVLHGCAVEDDCLIGIGAILLNGARIGRGSVVAAGSLVPKDAVVPPDTLALGVPAKVQRAVSADEKERFRATSARYVALSAVYKEEQS